MRSQTEDLDDEVTLKTAICVTPAVTTLKNVFHLTLCPSFGPSCCLSLSVCLSGCLHGKTVLHSWGCESQCRVQVDFFQLFPTLWTGCLWFVILLV
jgi:hypothetical protein